MRATLERSDALGLAVLAALILVASGGAASLPAGLALGAPHLAQGLVGLAALLALAIAARRGGPRRLIGLTSALALLALAAFVPELRAFSGPPLLALALGGAVLVLWDAGWTPRSTLLFPVLLALYCGVAARVQEQVGAEGDEPHYLMVADSILRDGDLSLEQDYARHRYAPFYRKPELEPHFRVRGRNGEIYSLHAVGLSLLILPAYALAGYPGVSFFMALLLALLVRELREAVRALSGRPALAEGVAWVAGLSPPLVHYAGLVFTEVPAALVLVHVLRRGLEREGRLRPRTALLLGLALASLPWLNVRYALLALLLAAFLLAARPPRAATAALLLPAAASGLALAAYHWILYGFFDPRLVYGRRPEFALATLKEGLPGLLLDQEFGLLVYAPALVLAVPGLLALGRTQRRLAISAGALLVSVLLVSGTWQMWRGGFNPPARFLVPVAPLLWLGAACWLGRGPRAAHALLLGWGLWTGLAGAWEPRLVHRDRDGTAPLFRTFSGAEEWTRLLPGYVLANPDRERLALVWSALLALSLAGARRGRPSGAWALAASVGVMAVAGATASALGVSRTGGRDAVRLIGRGTLELPALRTERSAVASWDASALSWGPLYEPHRHPDGAEIGSRLELPAGGYRLQLQGEAFPGDFEPLVLSIRDEPSGRSSRVGLEPVDGGWCAGIDVAPGTHAVTLAIRGGPPLELKGVSLAAASGAGSTIPACAGLIGVKTGVTRENP